MSDKPMFTREPVSKAYRFNAASYAVADGYTAVSVDQGSQMVELRARRGRTLVAIEFDADEARAIAAEMVAAADVIEAQGGA